MIKRCRQCEKDFEIPAEDLEYYRNTVAQEFDGKKFEMPEPSLCFFCRQQKRLAFRNEIFLYHRKCDFSDKQIISMYSEDKPYKIYDQHVWWGDDWDPLEYGRDFDFERPFFEQFKELQLEVPRMSLNNRGENSDYCNLALDNKNCYLIFTADHNEDCAYCRFSDRNFKCFDCDYTYDSNECYGCLDVEKGNRCVHSYKIINSSELWYCFNMIGCHDCIGCSNLRNQKNCIFNEQYSKEEYEAKKKELALHTRSGAKAFEQKYKEFLEAQIRRNLDLVNCENALGDHLRDCKNAQQCYNSIGLEDCKYIMNCYDIKDCYDWNFVGGKGSELCHEMASAAYGLVNCHFCANCWVSCSNMFYSELCLQSSNLFGCIGLRHKEYCILNKQYSKNEYEKLVAKIIEHMKGTGEWGEFFPMDVSTFAYNETVAGEYFPIEKEEILDRGWRFIDDDTEKSYRGPEVEIPDDVNSVDQEICKKILICEESKKPFKLIPQEIEFCKRLGIALSGVSPRERSKARMGWRNGWVLHDRNCVECGKEIKTTFSPDRKEPIYCQECYKAEIY